MINVVCKELNGNRVLLSKNSDISWESNKLRKLRQTVEKLFSISSTVGSPGEEICFNCQVNKQTFTTRDFTQVSYSPIE